jgi:methionyl-tRNA formyltransferase
VKIVFMGTPQFAVPCLQRLLEEGHDLLGVFTQPDKPKGRGYTLTPPPVKVVAQQNGIAVYQPKTLKDGKAVKILKELNPELIIVVAYGKILPKEILLLPKYGCINIHASILPKYRGAAPIQWAVINGDKETGVTSMYMDEDLDTGDMLIFDTVEIENDDSSGTMHDKLSMLGAQVLSKTIKKLEEGTLIRVKQNNGEATYAPILDKSMSPIDWNESAKKIYNKIRGLSPWPVATAKYGEMTIKIHKSAVTSQVPGKDPGEIVSSKDKLTVVCGDGECIEILQLQAPGSKAMLAQDFLRGHDMPVGTKFF